MSELRKRLSVLEDLLDAKDRDLKTAEAIVECLKEIDRTQGSLPPYEEYSIEEFRDSIRRARLHEWGTP